MRFSECEEAEGIINATQEQFLLVSLLTPVTGRRISFENLRNEILYSDPLSHDDLIDIGVNRHDDIDAHINNTIIHIDQYITWITPTLLNGWEAYDTNNTPKYAMTNGRILEIEGLVKSGSLTSPIFSLPVGRRPEREVRTTSWGQDVPCKLRIGINGDVYLSDAPAGKAWYSLHCIYHCEPDIA